MTVVISIIVALLILTVIVVVHELGHYGVGRLCKIKILEFAVGFGPKLVKWVRKGIQYSIRALPLGGFVQFYGEDEDKDDKEAFNNQPVGRRFLTVLAGPLMNIIFALLLTVVILMAYGDYVPAIGELRDGSPAQEAGLEVGDIVTSINGVNVDFVAELTGALEKNDVTQNMQITVERDGEALDFSIPYEQQEDGSYLVGITFAQTRMHFGFFEAIGLSFKWIYLMISEMLSALAGLIFAGRGAQDVAGIVGIVSIIGEAMRYGFETILRISVLLSINLGIVNLLPLPALDGGRLVFLAYEGISRRPVPRKVEGYIHFAGMVVLFGLMILITWQDIARLIGAV